MDLPFHKRDKSGFPKVLKPWKKLIKSSDPNHHKLVNTIFGAVKVLTLPVNRSTETITSPSTADHDVIRRFCDYIPTWSGIPGLSRLERQSVFLLRSTKGPNGPAVATCLGDLKSLNADPQLRGAVDKLIKLTCDPGIISY